MTNFKPAKGTAKADRRARTRLARKRERDGKAAVRKRDGACRFPLCGCYKHRYALHVSHQKHKGMGGNPAGDRSVAELMIRVCIKRHRESVYSIDRGGISWEALSADGANGPIRWLIDGDRIPDALRPVEIRGVTAYELAREVKPYEYESLTPWQRGLLLTLATMND